MFKTNLPYGMSYNFHHKTNAYYPAEDSVLLSDKFFDTLKRIERATVLLSFNMNPYATVKQYKNWVSLWKDSYNKITKIQRRLRHLRRESYLKKWHAGSNAVAMMNDLTNKINRLTQLANVHLNLRAQYKMLSSLQKWKEAA